MPRSDFTIGSTDGAWWLIGFTLPDGTRTGYRCAVNGFVFVRALQGLLGSEPSALSFDGHTYSGDMVSADGRWGPITSRVLWSALRRRGADPNLLTLVAYDAGWRGSGAPRGNPVIGYGSLKSAIWILHQDPVSVVAGGVPLSAINLPSDYVAPLWGRAGAVPTSGELPGITCELLDYADPDAAAATTPAPAPVPPVSAPVASDPAPVPAPQTQDVTDDIARPTGLSRVFGGSQVPWGIVLALGGVVAVIALSTASLNRTPGARGGRRRKRR